MLPIVLNAAVINAKTFPYCRQHLEGFPLTPPENFPFFSLLRGIFLFPRVLKNSNSVVIHLSPGRKETEINSEEFRKNLERELSRVEIARWECRVGEKKGTRVET